MEVKGGGEHVVGWGCGGMREGCDKCVVETQITVPLICRIYTVLEVILATC